MSRLSSNVISLSLVGAGALGWAMASRPLAQEPGLRIPSNPLGIKKSPYGEVFAMAMQGPIDTYWHGGIEGHHHHDEEGEEADHHDHDDCPDCVAEEKAKARRLAAASSASASEKFRHYLDELNEVKSLRTNPKPPTPEHRFAIRREIEDKLRFAYELDPSHYGNYNAYHLFLTEPSLGTRPELTPGAIKLADETIKYCLSRTDDPRPALTAAAAAEKQLLLMFNAPERFTTAQMRQVLQIVDYSLARHHEISRQWEGSGDWAAVSPLRQAEAAERFHFITKLREAADVTITRLEGKATTSQTATHQP